MDVLVCLLFLLVAAIESQTIFAERPQETCEKNGMYNDRCYLVGIGIADVTGPATETTMMGYAKFDQKTSGIHTRLFSRAFIFKSNSSDALVFVSVDVLGMGHAIKREVIKRLATSIGPGVYRDDNIMLSATHTHSGPGGYHQYFFPTIPNLGFIDESFQIIVNGIVKSITRAHLNIKPSKLYHVEGKLANANKNRSPSAYLRNPIEERLKYKSDTDHTFFQINIFDAMDETPRGVINWFAVHQVSMNLSNYLISGDNKGIASLIMEKQFNKGIEPGKGPFVAAFAQSNHGDTTPNLNGPICRKTGLPCDNEQSKCKDRFDTCVASGPGRDMFESTSIIAERQLNKSLELLRLPKEDQTPIEGGFQGVFQRIDMSDRHFVSPNGMYLKTCKAALGFSFAAGTTDGNPGAITKEFMQGDTNGHPFLKVIRDLIPFTRPPKTQIDCHAPKPIFLYTGGMNLPYQWHPNIVGTQIFKLGRVYILGGPSEFSTMAGRRLRETVSNIIKRIKPEEQHPKVVFTGMTSIYNHYVTTTEEYLAQRYEGASMLYGPYTLQAYQQQYRFLAEKLAKQEKVKSLGPEAPDLYETAKNYKPGRNHLRRVRFDKPPRGKNFGDCILQPPHIAKKGVDIVDVEFVSGNLRNNPLLERSFLYVERLDNEDWEIVAVDTDIETRLEWIRTNFLHGQSKVRISWEIPLATEPGTYRIRHIGSYKKWTIFWNGKTFDYEGSTRSFEVK